MTDTTKLLPCPFCGGEVQHRFALWPSHGDTDAIIHAAPSECGAGVFSIGTADDGLSVGAAWNRRLPSEADAILRELVDTDRAWSDAGENDHRLKEHKIANEAAWSRARSHVDGKTP